MLDWLPQMAAANDNSSPSPPRRSLAAPAVIVGLLLAVGIVVWTWRMSGSPSGHGNPAGQDGLNQAGIDTADGPAAGADFTGPTAWIKDAPAGVEVWVGLDLARLRATLLRDMAADTPQAGPHDIEVRNGEVLDLGTIDQRLARALLDRNEIERIDYFRTSGGGSLIALRGIAVGRQTLRAVCTALLGCEPGEGDPAGLLAAGANHWARLDIGPGKAGWPTVYIGSSGIAPVAPAGETGREAFIADASRLNLSAPILVVGRFAPEAQVAALAGESFYSASYTQVDVTCSSDAQAGRLEADLSARIRSNPAAATLNSLLEVCRLERSARRVRVRVNAGSVGGPIILDAVRTALRQYR